MLMADGLKADGSREFLMGAQLPLGPEELRAAPLDGARFLASLKQQRLDKYPEPPAFYQAMFAGELNRDDLHLWVKDLYNYWDHGVTYSTGAIFIKTNDEPTRTHILRRLVDIEGEDVVEDLSGSSVPAWEELWLRLGEGLGLSRDDITGWRNITRTHMAISTLCTYARYWDWTWLDGIAGFYASDLQGADYLGRAYESLRSQYAVPDAALEFFRVYLGDIAQHIPWEEQALAYWCCTTERQLTAARAFRERLDIENQLLVGVEKARTDGRVEFQVPA
jgi:pyrroloquinoline quinone (PQQ) biosynthesis protein C